MIIAALIVVMAVGTSFQGAQAPSERPEAPDTTRLIASLGVQPETVTVGQHFRSYISVRSRGVATVAFGDIGATDTLQMVDSLRTLAGQGSIAAAYTLAAWVADTPLRQTALVEILLPTGERRSYRVPLRLPVVRSVLPSDADVLPKPPKGMLRTAVNRFPWWILALLSAVVVGGIIVWWIRSPRKVLVLDPREEALASLAELDRDLSVPAEGRYALVSRIVRHYLGRIEPGWSEDLTTSELLLRVDRDNLNRHALGTLLHEADLVKFAALARTDGEATAYLVAAREWIASNPAGPVMQRAAA